MVTLLSAGAFLSERSRNRTSDWLAATCYFQPIRRHRHSDLPQVSRPALREAVTRPSSRISPLELIRSEFRASRKRAWEIPQEIRWVLKEAAGMEFPPAARKTIGLEGRVVKDAIRKALKDRQGALTDLVHAIREYRNLADQP